MCSLGRPYKTRWMLNSTARKSGCAFRHKRLIDSAKASFINAAGLDDISARADALQLAAPNCLQTLAKSKTPLLLLYIEDHNALGLPGDPHDREQQFSSPAAFSRGPLKEQEFKGLWWLLRLRQGGVLRRAQLSKPSSPTRDSRQGTVKRRAPVSLAAGTTKATNSTRRASVDALGSERAGRTRRPERKVVDPFEGSAADKLAGAVGL